MKVDAAYLPFYLVEADVVESLKTRVPDGSDPVVGYKEVFLPPHEYVFPLVQVLDQRLRALAHLLLVRPKRGELAPVLKVDFFACAPLLVLGDEAVFAADDLTLKVRGEGRVVISQTLRGLISQLRQLEAQRRGRNIP